MYLYRTMAYRTGSVSRKIDCVCEDGIKSLFPASNPQHPQLYILLLLSKTFKKNIRCPQGLYLPDRSCSFVSHSHFAERIVADNPTHQSQRLLPRRFFAHLASSPVSPCILSSWLREWRVLYPIVRVDLSKCWVRVRVCRDRVR